MTVSAADITTSIGTAIDGALANFLRRCAALLPVLLIQVVLMPQVGAVSLGDEQVMSLLGDPVEVEIDVLQWQDIALDRVRIAAASREDYAAFELAYVDVLDNLSFNLIGPNPDGRVKVLISSRDPIDEPFLELLLVLRWPGGSLLREYVLLFDPPSSGTVTNMTERATAVPAATARVPVQNATADSTPATIPAREQEPAVAKADDSAPVAREAGAQSLDAPAEAGQPDVKTQTAIDVQSLAGNATAAPVATGRRIYVVREEDNLWDIARQFQPAGTGENLYQVLLSIHDLNRSAFINGNISLLKADARLQIPGAGDISDVDAATAEAVFNQRWDIGTRGSVAAIAGEPLAIPGTAEPAVAALPDVAVATDPAIAADVANAETRAREAPASGLVPAADVAVVATQTASEAAGLAEPQGATAIPSASASAKIAEAAFAPGANPYLDRINASAESLARMLQSRTVQLAQLEQQVDAMRIRMAEARAIAATLNAALKVALENRAAREAAYKRNSMLLGAAFAVMFCGFAVAVMFALRLLRQLRLQRALPSHQRAARLSDYPDMPLRAAEDITVAGIWQSARGFFAY